MKTKYFMLAALALIAVPGVAQETYQDTKLIDNDLNGTARYVGMGGAMEALGADISTISTNPAGIGLFRKGQVSISGGGVFQQDAKTHLNYGGTNLNFDGNKNNFSFDQIGVVWSQRTGRNSYLNFGFNYHKSRNFDQILSCANNLVNTSQNKNTAAKYSYAQTLSKDEANIIWNGVDANYEGLMAKSADGKEMDYLNGTQYLFGQYQKGYIGEYDFNVSGNLNNRVFLGLTFGFHDVHYRSNSMYTEDLEQNYFATSYENLKITGNGFDLKLGAIFRPIEESPFRIGLYVSTPTFYDLTVDGDNDIQMGTQSEGVTAQKGNSSSYDFKVYTPWKFGVSLGHTVGDYLALGATYEYADYSHIDNRINDGGSYDWYYDEYYTSSSSDKYMNDDTKANLKGVSTLKFGLEYKPMPEFAIRLGYNYLSPMFKKNAYRDGTVPSPGVAYATSTDYTNWDSTNRVTCGFGYTVNKFFVDLAYQYTAQNGTFVPFMSYKGSDAQTENIPTASDVHFKRHQLLLTFGYKF